MSSIMDGHTPEEEKKHEGPLAPPSLKAAADLIQTLDVAYAEMTHCAADAAKDAEVARRNARAASEIARRYLNGNLPKKQFQFEVRASAPSPTVRDFVPRTNGAPPRPSERPEPVFSTPSIKLETTSSQGMNGVASKVASPRHDSQSKMNGHASLRASPNRNRPRTFLQTPTSADRIAQSHAEDVLSLSMDLEKSRLALKSEQRLHEESKSTLASQVAKSKTLEKQNRELQKQIQQLKGQSSNRVSDLEKELAESNYRVQAAEEDAQLALDLAKESAEKRDEMEDELQKTRQELEALKQRLQKSLLDPPKRAVRFADTEPEPSPKFGSSPARPMVAAGRQLLRRSLSPRNEVVTLEMAPAKSAERRRRLRERLTQLDTSAANMSQELLDASTSPNSLSTYGLGTPSAESAEFQTAAKVLLESGRRLELNGHWWHHETPQNLASVMQELESMTRQYCQSVELKMERQQKDIEEIESLCGFLETKIASGSN